MPIVIELENIEEMRQEEGIDDIELHAAIRGLRVGDHVKLTVLAGPTSFETLVVRITRIRGLEFHGKLVKKPVSHRLGDLEVGSLLKFAAAHIHSIPKQQPRTGGIWPQSGEGR